MYLCPDVVPDSASAGEAAAGGLGGDPEGLERLCLCIDDVVLNGLASVGKVDDGIRSDRDVSQEDSS